MKTSTHQSLVRFGSMIATLLLAGSAAAQQPAAPAKESATAGIVTGVRMKVEGMITERNGDTLTLRQPSSKSLEVKLSSWTQIREKKTNIFRRARKYRADELTPGLAVEVEGRGETDGALLADKILLTNSDLKLAQTVNARVAPVEENQVRMSGQIGELDAVSNAAKGGAKAAQATADSALDRISSLDDYEQVKSVTVLFRVGSAAFSEEARQSLDELAQEARNRKGYVVEVAGFASSEGNRAFNQRLSRQRAQAVSEYLAEKDDIPLRRMTTPTGYGISHPVSDNSTRAGRMENRRVEVRLLVSRGITAQSNTSQAEAAKKQSAGAQQNQPR